MTDKSEQHQPTIRSPGIRPNRYESRLDGEVRSVKRALIILNTLAEHDVGLTLKDLALKIELPYSTVHRLLTTLQSEHYTSFNRQGGLWSIGRQARTIAKSFDDRAGHCRPAGPRDSGIAERRCPHDDVR